MIPTIAFNINSLSIRCAVDSGSGRTHCGRRESSPPCEPCKFVRMVVTFVISAARFHLPSIMGSVSLVMRHIF